MSGLRRKGKNVIWNVCVPEELAVEAELFLASGAARPIYGLRSQVICMLLRRYIAEEKAKFGAHKPEPALPTNSTEKEVL